MKRIPIAAAISWALIFTALTGTSVWVRMLEARTLSERQPAAQPKSLNVKQSDTRQEPEGARAGDR